MINMHKSRTIEELYFFIRTITLTRQRLYSSYGSFVHREGKDKTWLILCYTEHDFAFMQAPLINKDIVIPKYASTEHN